MEGSMGQWQALNRLHTDSSSIVCPPTASQAEAQCHLVFHKMARSARSQFLYGANPETYQANECVQQPMGEPLGWARKWKTGDIVEPKISSFPSFREIEDHQQSTKTVSRCRLRLRHCRGHRDAGRARAYSTACGP